MATRISLRGMLTPIMLAAALTPQLSQAGPISFVFDYSGNTPGVGFLDPVAGAARQAALTTAGQLYSDLFGSHFSNLATITMSVTSTDDINTPTLASASTNFTYAPGTFGGGEVVRSKLVSNGATDLNGAEADGTVDVNWGYSWELDPNAPVGATTFDFFAALFHEFSHALGFFSVINGPAEDFFGEGSEGSGLPGTWSKWDEFMIDCNGSGAPLINPDTFEANQGAVSSAQANGGCFAGPNAVAAYGSAVPLYAEPGLSHLDEDTFSTPNVPENYMMKPFRAEGPQEARTWHPVEVGILADLGYTSAQAVPEPASMALLMAALGGLALTRRKV